jgi:hypothetical protein
VTNTESTAKGPARKSLGAAMVSISGTRDTVAYHSDRQRMDASGYETIPRSLEGFGDASHTTLKMGEREREVAGAGLSGWFPVTPLPQALWRLGDLLSIARNIEEGLYVARGYAHASHVRNQRQGRVAPSPLPRRPKDKGWSVMLRGEEWLAAPADRKKEGSNQSEARQISSPVRLFPKRCGRSVGRTRTAGRGVSIPNGGPWRRLRLGCSGIRSWSRSGEARPQQWRAMANSQACGQRRMVVLENAGTTMVGLRWRRLGVPAAANAQSYLRGGDCLSRVSLTAKCESRN